MRLKMTYSSSKASVVAAAAESGVTVDHMVRTCCLLLHRARISTSLPRFLGFLFFVLFGFSAVFGSASRRASVSYRGEERANVPYLETTSTRCGTQLLK